MQRVLVISKTKQPLMPCHPARARELLRKGKAKVYRMQPFTIILHERETGETQEVEFKVDPGSKTTGIALNLKGKKMGTYVGRVAVRSNGYFNIQTKALLVDSISYKRCLLLQRVDGYGYRV